jgi:AcrR family transcriptional regulator
VYIDRAAMVRRAFLDLVALHGFHGAGMAAVARRAGVAAGTIYVHYTGKDDLVLAVYREIKRDLGRAAVAGVDAAAPPRKRFGMMWRNVLAHLTADPDRARFLVQVDASPYAAVAHEAAMEDGDDPLLLAASAPDMVPLLTDLPLPVLYDLGFASAVRLVAAGDPGGVDLFAIESLVTACWRAVTRPGVA